jgi:hypothetical protein
MEYKLDRLGRSIQYGHHLYGERDARRIRTCVTLIRRLRADNYYWDEAKKVYGETGFAAQLAADNQRNDQRHLGVLLGKYLTHWWD